MTGVLVRRRDAGGKDAHVLTEAEIGAMDLHVTERTSSSWEGQGHPPLEPGDALTLRLLASRAGRIRSCCLKPPLLPGALFQQPQETDEDTTSFHLRNEQITF